MRELKESGRRGEETSGNDKIMEDFKKAAERGKKMKE